jgi:hypothetical protein
MRGAAPSVTALTIRSSGTSTQAMPERPPLSSNVSTSFALAVLALVKLVLVFATRLRLRCKVSSSARSFAAVIFPVSRVGSPAPAGDYGRCDNRLPSFIVGGTFTSAVSLQALLR